MSVRGARDRLRELLSRQTERAVSDEVEFHLEMQVRDLIAAGWTPEAARREASRMFGDVDRVREEMRALKHERERRARRREALDEIRSDVRFALRRCRRRPAFFCAAVLVLALGVGANVSIFSVVDATLLRPLPFPDADALVFLWDVQDGAPLPVSYPEFEDWQREGTTFHESLVTVMRSGITVRGPGGPERIEAGYVAGNLLGVAGLAPLIGRGPVPSDAESGTRVAFLGEAYWRAAYGASPDVVGRSIELDGEGYEIAGVVPDRVRLFAERRNVAVWLPLIRQDWMSRGLHFLRVVARLEVGLELAEAKVRADAMATRLEQSGVTRHGIALQELRERFVGDVRPLLLVLWGAVGFLLLIVCTNLANLFLSQVTGRAREFAVRSALGAGRARLKRQLLTESLVVGVLGGAIGLAIARLGTGYVADAAADAALLATPSLGPRTVAFAAGISVLAAIVFGLLPSARALSGRVASDLTESVAGRASGSRAARGFSRLLVGAEIALSVVLLVGAGLMVTSMVRLLAEDSGFEPDGVISLELDLPQNRYQADPARIRFFDRALDRIRSLAGVVEAAAVSHVPLAGSDTDGDIAIPGREYADDAAPHAQKRVATPRYFETMRIPLVEGRTFREGDGVGGRQVAIVSRSFAEAYWPGEHVVGRQLEFRWGTQGAQEIIGVVEDVRHDGLDVPVEGTVYVPNALFASGGLSIVTRASGDPLGLVQAIRRELREIDPLLPVTDIATLETIIARSVTTRRVFMTLLVGFAAVAVVLAVVGVYAVTSSAVAARTREIGVRLAMGATPGQVLRMILSQEMRIIAPGVVLGLLGALALSRTLGVLLYEVSASDPRTFAGVGVLLAGVAVAAVLIPGRRAAALDPTDALRID